MHMNALPEDHEYDVSVLQLRLLGALHSSGNKALLAPLSEPRQFKKLRIPSLAENGRMRLVECVRVGWRGYYRGNMFRERPLAVAWRYWRVKSAIIQPCQAATRPFLRFARCSLLLHTPDLEPAKLTTSHV
jgi:hypothetical protein